MTTVWVALHSGYDGGDAWDSMHAIYSTRELAIKHEALGWKYFEAKPGGNSWKATYENGGSITVTIYEKKVVSW